MSMYCPSLYKSDNSIFVFFFNVLDVEGSKIHFLEDHGFLCRKQFGVKKGHGTYCKPVGVKIIILTSHPVELTCRQVKITRHRIKMVGRAVHL